MLSLAQPLNQLVANPVPPVQNWGLPPPGDKGEFRANEDLSSQGSESVSLRKAPQYETFLQDESWQAFSLQRKSIIVCIFCFVAGTISTRSSQLGHCNRKAAAVVGKPQS